MRRERKGDAEEQKHWVGPAPGQDAKDIEPELKKAEAELMAEDAKKPNSETDLDWSDAGKGDAEEQKHWVGPAPGQDAKNIVPELKKAETDIMAEDEGSTTAAPAVAAPVAAAPSTVAPAASAPDWPGRGIPLPRSPPAPGARE